MHFQGRIGHLFCLRSEASWHGCRARDEKFDTELFSDFSAKSSNFRRLVLGCIKAKFCVQIFMLLHFSRSTRLPHLCTARNSKSSQIFVKLFHSFAEISAKIMIFLQISSNFAQISMKISQNFDEQFQKISWILKFLNIWWIMTKFPEMWQNF